jgi:hypothetical protein
MDWHQLWEIALHPDNIPILMLMGLVPFYVLYGLRQAWANDRLIARLEADPQLAETHHRTTFPYQEGWPKLVHVWPYLLKIEFLAAIVVTVILIVWSIVLDAPLEEPANPNFTMNPAKAPWYFLGLQEMLVYFDPWLAGVVFPTLIVIGLMMIPYCDVNPLGNGYYTYQQRKFALWTFLFGFLVLWLTLIFIGVFIRGPGWMWFWPGQTWDHHRQIYEVNRDLHQVVGLTNPWVIGIFGALVLLAFGGVASIVFHKLFTKFKPREYAQMNFIQYALMHAFMISMVALPIKILLRLAFRIKYVWVTPWFNV